MRCIEAISWLKSISCQTYLTIWITQMNDPREALSITKLATLSLILQANIVQ